MTVPGSKTTETSEPSNQGNPSNPSTTTTSTSQTTTPSIRHQYPDLQERLSDLLFWPDIGDEFTLTKSGRLKLVVSVNIIADGSVTPLPRTVNQWSLSDAVLEHAHAWAELMDDPLVD